LHAGKPTKGNTKFQRNATRVTTRTHKEKLVTQKIPKTQKDYQASEWRWLLIVKDSAPC